MSYNKNMTWNLATCVEILTFFFDLMKKINKKRTRAILNSGHGSRRALKAFYRKHNELIKLASVPAFYKLLCTFVGVKRKQFQFL